MPQRYMLSDITTVALERSLSGAYARQLAIADNVANIETPGYQAKEVSFEQNLRAAIEAERSDRFGKLRAGEAHPMHSAGGTVGVSPVGIRRTHVTHCLGVGARVGTRRAPIEAVQPRVGPKNAPARHDGNTVNLEAEMVAMSKNSLHYKMLARLLAKKLRMMRRAINGGSSE